MLAVDFDNAGGNGPQRLGAQRLVVEKGAGAAIGHLDAAQQQVAIDVEVLRGGRKSGRVVLGQIEDRRHLALSLALAHQRAITAPAESQGKGIEQDRFARPGLACQHCQPVAEIQIQPINQHDIADGQLDKHAGDSNPRLGAHPVQPKPILRNIFDSVESSFSSGSRPLPCNRA